MKIISGSCIWGISSWLFSGPLISFVVMAASLDAFPTSGQLAAVEEAPVDTGQHDT